MGDGPARYHRMRAVCGMLRGTRDNAVCVMSVCVWGGGNACGWMQDADGCVCDEGCARILEGVKKRRRAANGTR